MSAKLVHMPAGQTIQIVIIDDSPRFVDAVRRLLSEDDDIEIVATAGSIAEGREILNKLSPDLVILDVALPDGNGIDFALRLKGRASTPLIVIVTLYDSAEYRAYATLAGLDHFICKSDIDVELPQLLDRVRLERTFSRAKSASRPTAAAQPPSLQQTLDASGIGVFDWDLRTGEFRCSEALAACLALQPNQQNCSYEDLLRSVHPDDLNSVQREIEAAKQANQAYRQTFRVVDAENNIRYLQLTGRFSYNTAFQALKMTGVALDVSEPMRLSMNLKSASSKLQAISTMAPHCITVMDEAGVVQEMNPAGRHLIGVAETDRIVGHHFKTFVAPEYWDEVNSLLKDAVNGSNGSSEFQIVTTQGARRWMKSHAALLPSGDRPPCVLSLSVDITEQKTAVDRLSFLAQHDALTGLPNRFSFSERLQQAIAEAAVDGHLTGVAFLDLDGFKLINDTMGHDSGDIALVAVAARLREALRPGDTVARIGGDEFAIILANLTDAEAAPLVAERILHSFAQPFQVDGRELHISASLGVTLYPTDETEVEALLRNADTAMYHAKEQGRSACQFYTPDMTERANDDLALQSALRYAVERNELFLEYQPITDMETGQLKGFEALMRWLHPQRGVIAPGRFIPLAEESGLIRSMGDWALREACTQLRAWDEEGLPHVYVAVNISSQQFRKHRLLRTVREILHETGLAAERLRLELTESMLLANVDQTIHTLIELHDEGVSFAIDDFGTGYSSLSYLKRFPIDILKIDQSFVRDINSDPNDAAIVSAITTMAHSLGMKVIAEGVETRAQFNFLREHQCDAMQGYLISRPLPVDRARSFLAHNSGGQGSALDSDDP